MTSLSYYGILRVRSKKDYGNSPIYNKGRGREGLHLPQSISKKIPEWEAIREALLQKEIPQWEMG